MADDLYFQNISTVQSNAQPSPVTLASATTIAPTTFITFVSGTIDIADITPPVTGSHMLVLIPTDATPGDFLTTGNITLGSTTVTQNVPLLFFYNPITGDYFVK